MYLLGGEEVKYLQKPYLSKEKKSSKRGGETNFMNRRILCLLLVLTLLFSLPFSALASNGPLSPTDVLGNTPKIFGDFDFNTSEKQSIIVEFTDEPVITYKQNKSVSSVNSYTNMLVSTQQSFINSIKNINLDADILSSYKTVFNGMALSIPGDEINSLLQIPGVKAIYPVVEYKVDPIVESVVTPQVIDSAPLIGVTEDVYLTGQGIKIGIIDTGVDYNHPWLSDQFEGGFDFVDNDNDPMETLPIDPNPNYATYHGTHVAGITSYIAPDASLYAYRVLGPYGEGSTETVLAGVEQAVTDEMDIINLSLGNDSNDSDDALAIALNNAMDAGIVAVAANGNSGPDEGTVGSPATSLKAISVGASDFDDLIADFSSRGPVYNNLGIKPDIVAPGVDILSSVPYYSVGNDEGDYTGAYAILSGTSMAAPHVTGVAALLQEKYPSWSTYDIKAALMNNAVQLDGFSLNEQGAGRIDLTKTLNATAIASVNQEDFFEDDFEIYSAGSISFGVVYSSDTRQVVVKDVYGQGTQFFDVDVVWYTPGVDATVTADVYGQLEVEAGGSSSFNVDLELGEDAIAGNYEGGIVVSNTTQELTIPFNFYVNPIEGVYFDNWITNEVPVTYDVYLRGNVDGLIIDLFDWSNFGYLGEIETDDTPKGPGIYQYSFDSYLPIDDGGQFLDERVPLQDGYYLVMVSTMYDRYGYLEWITVDRQSPQITLTYGMVQQVSSSTINLSGQVSDLLIDIENPHLTVHYSVYYGDELSVDWTELDFNDDGTFVVENVPLGTGENTVKFNTEDAAGNGAYFETIITRVASSSGSNPPPPSGGGGGAPEPESDLEDQVQKALKDKETTSLSLKNGLTLEIPANSAGLENASGRIQKATQKRTEELLDTLALDNETTAFGSYYDFDILDENGEAVKNPTFDVPVTVSIPVADLDTGDLHKEKLSLFKIYDDGTVQLIGGRVKDGILTAEIDSFSRYMVMGKDKKFEDVSQTNYSWAVNQIEVLASKDIINGLTETTFAPQENITRAEFTALLVRVLGLKTAEGTDVAFDDVKEDAWYYDAVQAAVSNGLIQGYNDSIFAPDRYITRAEMAVVVGRALTMLGIQEGSADVLSMFKDRDLIKDWAVKGVSTVVETGIMQGRGEDRFVAEELTTRAEAAVVIYRIFNQ